jgi:hypothetical protein
MENSLWKYGVWESYKSIAIAHGLTIAALKRHLSVAGWLLGTRPTEQAVNTGVAVVEQLTGGRYGDVERILWNVPVVVEYLTAHGAPVLDEERARFYIRHRHQAVDRISEAALEIGQLFGADRERRRRVLGDAAAQVESDLEWFEYESHHLIITATEPEKFREIAEGGLRSLYEAAAALTGSKRKKYEYWRSVADNAVEWVVSRRLEP